MIPSQPLRFLCLVACFALLLLSETWAVDPPFLNRLTLSTFDSNNETGVLQTIAPDGSDRQAVAKLPDGHSINHIRVSPDGIALALTVSHVDRPRDAEGFLGDVWIYQDGNFRELGLTGLVGGWSPDGKQVVVNQTGADGEVNVLIVESATGVTVDQVEIPAPIVAVSDWSPDGEWFCLMMRDESEKRFARRTISIYSLHTEELKAISGDPLTDSLWGAFSPDGTSVAHYLRSHDPEDISRSEVTAALSSIDGKTARRKVLSKENIGDVTYTPQGASCWSPDGKQIAWFRIGRGDEGLSGDFDLLVVDAEKWQADRLPLPWLNNVAFIDW